MGWLAPRPGGFTPGKETQSIVREHLIFYFRHEPYDGYILAEICSCLFFINKSCVYTEYIIFLVIDTTGMSHVKA
jgi:hypothetical protein